MRKIPYSIGIALIAGVTAFSFLFGLYDNERFHRRIAESRIRFYENHTQILERDKSVLQAELERTIAQGRENISLMHNSSMTMINETTETRLREMKEDYQIGYEKGRADERLEQITAN